MQRRPVYYLLRLSVVTVILVGGWVAFLLIGSSWWQLVTAAFLAVTFTQVGLIGHDQAHRQVFRTRRSGDIAGLIAGDLGVGMSYGWWMDKHTRHHNNPNHDDLDPRRRMCRGALQSQNRVGPDRFIGQGLRIIGGEYRR